MSGARLAHFVSGLRCVSMNVNPGANGVAASIYKTVRYCFISIELGNSQRVYTSVAPSVLFVAR